MKLTITITLLITATVLAQEPVLVFPETRTKSVTVHLDTARMDSNTTATQKQTVWIHRTGEDIDVYTEIPMSDGGQWRMRRQSLSFTANEWRQLMIEIGAEIQEASR